MTGELQNPRRAPRVPARLRVEVRHGFSAWRAETEDVSPAGCQLVTPRLVKPGRKVRVTLEATDGRAPLRTSARVVWAWSQSPCRLGLRFARSEQGWFARLCEADASSAAAARRFVERLPRWARLQLGVPPRLLVDFTADELAVLRRVGEGVTAEQLATALGAGAERVVGAVFALLARRFLVLAPVDGGGPAAWSRILDGDGSASRPDAAQKLYEEGLALLAAGRLVLAVHRLKEAAREAPSDEVIQGQLARLSRWG